METSRESEADRIAVDGDDGRLGRLEDAIRQQTASSARLEVALATLITNLTPPAPPPEADKPNRPMSGQLLVVAKKETKLKPSAPSDYNGDRKEGRHFLNQCELYIRLRSADFPDSVAAVI